MSLFGFGDRHTDLFQLEELNFVSFEELLNTNNTFVEANQNLEDIFVEIVDGNSDDEDDEDFMFKSVNTTVLGQFASFEASMNVDRREVDDSNGSGVRGCIYNSPSYVCDYSKTTFALFGGDLQAIDKEKKHSLVFDPSVVQGVSKKTRRDVSAGRTPLVPDCESFLSPTHFALEGQSKDCVLSLMEDHLDNQEASFSYSEADSVWQVSVTDPDSPSGRHCEFVVSLYATVECARHVQSGYLLEALHLYGDTNLFATSFEGIRAIFQDVEEVEEQLEEEEGQRSALRCEDGEYFSRNENRAALIAHIDMPVSDSDGDSIVSVVLHQRRLQGAEHICELSAIREMGPILVDVGAVSALLTVFRHCSSDASAEVESLDNAIIPCAVGALSLLMHHKAAQILMARHSGLLHYLRERVLMASSEGGGHRLLRADVSVKVRAMLVLLCRSHPEEVLSLLHVDSLQAVFSPVVSVSRRKVNENPLVSRGDKLHYGDSVSVDRFYSAGSSSSRSGLSSTLNAIHI